MKYIINFHLVNGEIITSKSDTEYFFNVAKKEFSSTWKNTILLKDKTNKTPDFHINKSKIIYIEYEEIKD